MRELNSPVVKETLAKSAFQFGFKEIILFGTYCFSAFFFPALKIENDIKRVKKRFLLIHIGINKFTLLVFFFNL